MGRQTDQMSYKHKNSFLFYPFQDIEHTINQQRKDAEGVKMELIRVTNSLTLLGADKQKAAQTAFGKLSVRQSVVPSLGLSVSLYIGLL